MRRKASEREPALEIEVQITWRQWHDGRWEAWVTDETGRPPHLVRDQAELERFLAQAYRSGGGGVGGSEPHDE
jgi:hypothetical protein